MQKILTYTLLTAATTFILSASALTQDTAPCVSGGFITVNSFPSREGSPFSAVIKTTFDQKLVDGNSIHGTFQYPIARDAAGKTLSGYPLGCYIGDDGLSHQSYQVSVTDPVAKTSEHWQVGTNSAKVVFISHIPTPVKPSEAEMAANANRARTATKAMNVQSRTERLGSRTFQGVSAEGIRTTRTIPAGEEGNALPLEIMAETWRSKELGLVLMSINDDPRRGRTTAEIDDLRQGEPDPAMFAPPKDFTVKDQNPVAAPAVATQ